MIFAEASNAFAGQWFMAATSAVGGLVSIFAIASFFATRSEVLDLKDRQGKTEELIESIRTDGSKRGKHLHNRIDRTNRLLDRIAGKLGVGMPHDEPSSDDE